MELLRVGEAGMDEKYLGCPISVGGYRSFDYIVEKFEKRLNSWKSNFLTHAGRLVLIKSVMDSLPVYAMGTIIFPSKVIRKLTAIAHNFFWGGKHDKKSMSYVAWDSVTTPKGMGGLGLRHLKEVNKALVMKTMWKLATGANMLWAHLMQAKYYPRGALWSTQRRTNCSKLWKQLMDLRSVLINHICWKVGSGEQISLYSQPWFPGWTGLKATNKRQREATVASLLNPGMRSWNFAALQEVFGYNGALLIATMETIRPSPNPTPDTLIFRYAKNGRFSVKKAYQLLRGLSGQISNKTFWDWLWKKSQLTQKLKLFIWRAVHGALPVRAVLAYRIRHLSPTCQLCNREPETVMHALFHCDFAKRAWLVSALPMRSENLVGNFKETTKHMAVTLTDTDMCSFISNIWAIWRSRNEAMYGEKRQSIGACHAFYKAAMDSCEVRILTRNPLPSQGQRMAAEVEQSQRSQHSQQVNNYICYVDGSWEMDGAAGIGVCLMQHGQIILWISRTIQAVNPAQAEARAVLEGLNVLTEMGYREGTVYSDSKEIVLALANKVPNITDWRSFDEIWKAWNIQARASNRIKVVHCSRDHPNLVIVHRLANQGLCMGGI